MRAAADAESRLAGFIAKFAPAHRALIRAARRQLRRRFPTATELVYDNYNFLVIGYAPSPRPSSAILSIAAAANGVNLCFLFGATLKDPAKLLVGAGKRVRMLRLESAAVLERPELAALLDAAEAQSKVPFAETGRGPLVIRSVSAKQRPRRTLSDEKPSSGSTRSPLPRLRRLCLALPQSVEQEAWGAPTFRVKRGKMFAIYTTAPKLNVTGRGQLWMNADHTNQQLLVARHPTRYFVPPYVGGYGWIGAWMDGVQDWAEITDLLRDAWRRAAPRSVLTSRDAASKRRRRP